MYTYTCMHAITVSETMGYEFEGVQEGAYGRFWREKRQKNIIIML